MPKKKKTEEKKTGVINLICVSKKKDIKGLLLVRRKIWWKKCCKKKRKTKMTSFPAPGIEPWPRTATWCGQMLYPLSCGELVGMYDWTLKSCLGVLCTAKIKPRNICAIWWDEKNLLCNGLQLIWLVKGNLVHLDLSFLLRSTCLLLFSRKFVH